MGVTDFYISYKNNVLHISSFPSLVSNFSYLAQPFNRLFFLNNLEDLFTVGCRQLEAVIRIAESLAKMQLQPFATETHIDEALRLFQVSTLDAAMSGSLAGN